MAETTNVRCPKCSSLMETERSLEETVEMADKYCPKCGHVIPGVR